jgi:membrane dipeptidase
MPETTKPLIVDAHQDLAWNALNFGRDYSRSALETRRLEQGTPAPERNGQTLLGLPEYRQGQVAVVFGTLFVAPAHRKVDAWDQLCYATPADAHRLYAQQLDYYRRLADEHPEFALVGSQAGLDAVLDTWAAGEAGERRVGLVPLMEGADGLRDPQEAAWWQERGLRIVGLAWAATRYAGGTAEPGPLTPDGRRLLGVLEDLGLMLDLAHASDESFLEALERFGGVALCSHANPRALVKDFARPERLLSDDMIHALAQAGGVIGVVPYNRFLQSGWTVAAGKAAVGIDVVAAHVDYICQLTGSARHVGLGSDFDGGFGWERVPAEIDTIADLQKLAGVLQARGYAEADVAAILGQNWLNLLRRGLPA